ncbi:hypothetical protein Tco_0153355 [Tanacetum coccineum]
MAENVIVAGAENRPPMLKKGLYDSWKSKITVLAIEGTEKHKRLQELEDHTPEEKLRKSCNIKATNIILLGFVVPSFLSIDDLIASLNKAMMFLSTAISSRFPPTNNQLRTLSNPQIQVTIQDGTWVINTVGDVKLHTTCIFKADHVDAFDLDCDEALTASAIFMGEKESKEQDAYGSGEKASIAINYGSKELQRTWE